MARVGVIGGGAFGTALACVVRRSGHATVIEEAVARLLAHPYHYDRVTAK